MSAIDRQPITQRDLASLEQRIKAELEVERHKRVVDGIIYGTVLLTAVAMIIVLFVVR
ncbi:MAG TPA: hypothetical protein VM938_03540 [Acidimicrobiales bacterium]|nr:hypothetical protein [Acidimicrobiales bacterium]